MQLKAGPPRHRHSPRSGFSLAETFAALALLGLVAMGISSVVKSLDSGTHKARLVGTMIAVESSISEALLSASSFEGYRSTLASPTTPLDQFTLEFMGMPLASFNAGVPGKRFFNLTGTPCTPGPLSRNCLVEVDFYIRREAPAGPVPGYQVIYRISALGSSGRTSTPFPPLGLPLGQDLATGQMGIRIPSEFYTPQGRPSCREGSDAELVLRGYDSVTGAALCWNRPSPALKCPADSVPVGLEAVTEGALKVRCQPARRIVCNNSKYALTTASGRASLVATAPAGTCVYRGVSPVEARTQNGVRYCPSDYQLSGTNCTLALDRTISASSVAP